MPGSEMWEKLPIDYIFFELNSQYVRVGVENSRKQRETQSTFI